MVLKFYYDFISQPCRSLYILLKLTNTPFQAYPVNLLKGEQLSEDFKEKCSKFQKVPVIHDGNFRLTESVSILRYLAREYSIDDHWYPKESKEQARIDEFLEWQHLNLRLNCLTFFRTTWILPLKTGVHPTEEKVSGDKKALLKSLTDFDQLFLGDGLFIHGNQISYSDIHAACEIEQPKFGGYDPREDYPRIKSWLDNVEKACNPYYAEAHEFLNKVAKEIEDT
uniref:Putative glutathione S-transferase theta class member 2 n=1 Tax=Leptinotarsa decemlineata TaxID=7539 RepID=A0A1P8PEW6_LEPDE|nr:putative glutathione S-transferase theta class member 2 [Leptinotarsa decemlineata]